MKDKFGGRIKQLKKLKGQKYEVSLEIVPSSDKTLSLMKKWKSEGQDLDVIMAER